MIESFFYYSGFFLFYYFLAINSLYFLLILFAIPSIYRRFLEVQTENILDMVNSESLPEIAIIIPCYNLQELVFSAMNAGLMVDYPRKKIVIINDGSTDSTLEFMKERLELYQVPKIADNKLETASERALYRSKKYSEVLVIDKENGGRSDALNTGINNIQSEYFLVIDGDTVLEKDALLRMVRPFFTQKNVVAQGGTLRILNGCAVVEGRIELIDIPRNYFAGIQVVEYLRSFLYGRLGWNYLGGNVIVSGAFGLFDTKAVIEANGYDTKSIGEDFDLTIRLIKNHFDNNREGIAPINFIPDPVAWTEVPSSYRGLLKQRSRWHQGLCQTVFKMWSMFLNPRYRMTGLVSFPYMFFGELIEPIIECFGIALVLLGYSFGFYSGYDCLLIVLVAWGLTAALSMITVFMEITTFRRYRSLTQLGRLLIYSFLESLGFRQMYIWWRFVGFYKYFKGAYEW